MALTVANTNSRLQALSLGNVKGALVTVTFDSSYAAGGESLTPSDVGLAEFYAVIPLNDASTDEFYVPQYDYTAETLMLFEQNEVAASPLVEVTGTTDVSAVTVRVLCIGA